MSTEPMSRSEELLSAVRQDETNERNAEIRKVKHIVEWATDNTVTAPADAATICEGRIDTGLPIAGEGAPLVSEFALMELCAVLGRSPRRAGTTSDRSSRPPTGCRASGKA